MSCVHRGVLQGVPPCNSHNTNFSLIDLLILCYNRHPLCFNHLDVESKAMVLTDRPQSISHRSPSTNIIAPQKHRIWVKNKGQPCKVRKISCQSAAKMVGRCRLAWTVKAPTCLSCQREDNHWEPGRPMLPTSPNSLLREWALIQKKWFTVPVVFHYFHLPQ